MKLLAYSTTKMKLSFTNVKFDIYSKIKFMCEEESNESRVLLSQFFQRHKRIYAHNNSDSAFKLKSLSPL